MTVTNCSSLCSPFKSLSVQGFLVYLLEVLISLFVLDTSFVLESSAESCNA